MLCITQVVARHYCTLHQRLCFVILFVAVAQSQMKEVQRKSQQRIQEKQKKVQDLKQAVSNLKVRE